MKPNIIKKKIINILRWSEKYTKTDMVYLASGGFWLMLAQGVGAISAFAVTVLLTRTLPKEVFGQYRFVLSIIPMLAVFTLPGIGTALTRAVARGAEPDLHQIARVKIKWGLLGSLASLIIVLYYFTQGNTTLVYTFGIAALFIPFYEAFFIYSFYYKGKEDFKTPSIYEAISRVIQAIILIITAITTHSPLALVIAFFAGQIATRLFFYVNILRKKNRKRKEKKKIEDTNEIERYGIHLTYISVIGIILVNIDKILLWHYFDAVTLATYTVATTIPLTIIAHIDIITQLVLPKLSSLKITLLSFKKILLRISVVTLVTFILPIAYIPLSEPLMHILFPTYPETIHLSIVSAFLIPVSIFSSLVWQMLLSQKHKKYIPIILFVGGFLMLSVFYIFKDTLGATAIIVATATHHIVIAFLMLLSFYKSIVNCDNCN